MIFRPDFFILCENVLIADNKPSLLNIYEVILAPQVPTAHNNFWFAARVFAKNDSARAITMNFEIKLIASEGTMVAQVSQQDSSLQVDAHKERTIGAIFNLSGTTLPTYGDYTAELYVNNEKVTDRKFIVQSGER